MNSIFANKIFKRKLHIIRSLSLLVQVLYLVYPLSMYMIYLKVMKFQNKATMITVISFLLITCALQNIIKYYKQLAYNSLKYSISNQVKLKSLLECIYKNDNNKFHHTHLTYYADFIITEILNTKITKVNYLLLFIYFILIFFVANWLVLIPIICYGTGYIIAKKSRMTLCKLKGKYYIACQNEITFFKEHLTKIEYINGLQITEKVEALYIKIYQYMNKQKFLCTSIENKIARINKTINVFCIVMIATIGALLAKINFNITPLMVTTSIVLTVWVSRTVTEIYNHITASHMIDWLENKTNANVTNATNYNTHINHNVSFFYGSILDNVTMFDKKKYNQAHEVINKLGLDKLIANLPYLYNYVIIGRNDDCLPMDLKIGLSVAREIISGNKSVTINTRDISRKLEVSIKKIADDYKINITFDKEYDNAKA